MNQVRSEAQPFDFKIRSPDGQHDVIIEAKRRFGANLSWAAQWHQAMKSKIGTRSVVLITPEHLYGWK
jgi:hypothetical protein